METNAALKHYCECKYDNLYRIHIDTSKLFTTNTSL